MTIKKTLESFDEKFPNTKNMNLDITTVNIKTLEESTHRIKIKDFIKESIIQALDEITPERREEEELSISYGGHIRNLDWNKAIDMIDENVKKFFE